MFVKHTALPQKRMFFFVFFLGGVVLFCFCFVMGKEPNCMRAVNEMCQEPQLCSFLVY